MTDVYDVCNDPVWPQFLDRVAGDLQEKIVAEGWMLINHPEFPHQFHETVDFVLSVDEESYTAYYFQYRIKYFPPTARWRSHMWKAFGKPRVPPGTPEHLLGCVVIDPLIYEDPGPLGDRLTNGLVALDLMRESVKNNRFVRLAFEVHAIYGEEGEILEYRERMLARSGPPTKFSELDQVVEQFRERTVLPRNCIFVNCSKFLPPVGPDYCLEHMTTPPG
ncbi:hypothetical protein C8R45DRAFT_464653 [Mycena sanguinolenta]|nr:hypothetical protein C8R45DRAFT_464653 [Mycena sanguinolenta]